MPVTQEEDADDTSIMSAVDAIRAYVSHRKIDMHRKIPYTWGKPMSRYIQLNSCVPVPQEEDAEDTSIMSAVDAICILD